MGMDGEGRITCLTTWKSLGTQNTRGSMVWPADSARLSQRLPQRLLGWISAAKRVVCLGDEKKNSIQDSLSDGGSLTMERRGEERFPAKRD